ncbi:hypothetical protein V4S38_07055 [Enterococcus cecorum]
MLGSSQKAFQQVDFHSQKLKAITEEDFMSHKAMAKLAYYQSDLPLYLSVDKDILTKKDAMTNWNQGQLDISTLRAKSSSSPQSSTFNWSRYLWDA